MRQLEEENLRLKKQVADLSPDRAMLQDVLAKKNRRWRDCANGSGICSHATEPAKGKYAFPCGSVAAYSDIVLRRHTTVRYACASGRLVKPGSTMTTAEFTSCSGVKAGGKIINTSVDSTASRVCPCVSNVHVITNRHSADNPSLRYYPKHGLCL